MYQFDIATCKKVPYGRWLEIKRNLKLCNNNVEEMRQDQNPSHKFDYIYQALVHNVKEFTKKSCLDLVIDESTWPYYGFGGMFVNYLTGKMCTRGGQSVILMDCDRIRPRGVIHRHKGYKKAPGFTQTGPSEVHDLISKYVLPEIGEGKLWSRPPHLTVDNFFNGDQILSWMGERGLGMLGTVARNKLPLGRDGNEVCKIESRFFHKERTEKKGKARVARMGNPITMVRDVAGTPTTKPYRRVHVSFQSTGPCNLGSVNSISASNFYLSPRERGKGVEKRKWGIEMNQSRETYLSTYGKLDQTDAFISRAAIKYRSWKYYHAAVNHCKGLVIATAYDMYLECCEGNLNPDWELNKQ